LLCRGDSLWQFRIGLHCTLVKIGLQCTFLACVSSTNFSLLPQPVYGARDWTHGLYIIPKFYPRATSPGFPLLLFSFLLLLYHFYI
jgi:hypothetical protein